MPTPMSVFGLIAQRFGADPTDEAQIDRFYSETVSGLRPSEAQEVLNGLLDAQRYQDEFKGRAYEPALPLPRLDGGEEAETESSSPPFTENMDYDPSYPRHTQEGPQQIGNRSPHLESFLLTAIQDIATLHYERAHVRQQCFLADLHGELTRRTALHRARVEWLHEEPFGDVLMYGLRRAATSEHRDYTEMLANLVASTVDPVLRPSFSPHLLIRTVSDCSFEHLSALILVSDHSTSWNEVTSHLWQGRDLSDAMTRVVIAQLDRMGLVTISSEGEVRASELGSIVAIACTSIRR